MDPTDDIDTLWVYGDPAGTAERFSALLPSLADQPDRTAELLTQIARTHSLRRQFAAAHATLDRAHALLSDGAPRVRVRYWLERGRTFNSAGLPAPGCDCFRLALRLATAIGADALAVDAAHMLGIAETPDRRLAWNERALAMAERSTDPKAQRWAGSLYNNLGWTYHDRGDFDAALMLFERALTWHLVHGTPQSIHIARWSVARAWRSLGRVGEALAAQRALFAALTATNATDVYVLEEIAECLHALGDHAAARPFFTATHAELAADAWLQANEPQRLARLARLAAEPI